MDNRGLVKKGETIMPQPEDEEDYLEKLKQIQLPPRMYPPEHPGNIIRASSLISQLVELSQPEDDENLEEGEEDNGGEV